jgi:hypothetical protein
MSDHKTKKMHTMRHFLFYIGVACALGALIGVAHSLMDWSNGLTFAVAVAAGTISCTLALREDLFESPRAARERRDQRA